MWHLLKLKCAQMHIHPWIYAYYYQLTFTLTRVPVPNLALTHMKRITVWLKERVSDFLYSDWKSGLRITCIMIGRAGCVLPVLSFWKSELRITCTLIERAGYGLSLFCLKTGLRITCILMGRAGYELPVLRLEERVTDYLYSDWKSGLRITCTLTGKAGCGGQVPRSDIAAQSAMLRPSERAAKGKIKDGQWSHIRQITQYNRIKVCN